jgi:K+-sensing histidine kinase KdpD
MDIYIYIKRTTAYSLAVGMLTAVFVVIVLILTRYVTNLTRVSSFSITIFAAIIIALLFNPLRNRIQAVIDKVFYKKTYDFYDIIQKTSQGLSDKVSLDAIYDFIGKIIFNTLGLSSLYLLSASVGDFYRVVYKMTSKGGDGVDGGFDKRARIDKDSGIVGLLNRTRKIVLYELLNEEDIGEEEVEEIKKTLRPFEVEVIVPIFVDDKLSHIMLLGRKTSGDVFSLEDIHLLNTLSNQISVAIKQAWLYSEKVFSEKLASIGMMSATFAHEIRNPLTSLRTFTQLMPERYYDPDFRETFKRVVSFDIERIEGLIRDLLDFSSPARPRGRDRFDLIKLIDETVDYVEKKFELQKRHITIEKDYGDTEINMTGDVNRLKHAFVNIMTNGCQAMHEGGTLRVGIVCDGKNVNVAISDTGIGVDPDDIDRIFEPFYTTKEKGMGLGLAISKRAIEENGGSIKVESRVGEGTTFTVILPLTEG